MAEVTEASSEDGVRSRGNVLALLGGAVAGAVAGVLSRPDRALGGHDSTNVLHLGEFNNAPPDSATHVNSNVNSFGVSFDNEHTGAQAGGIHTFSRGQQAALQANAISPSIFGVFGISSSSPSPEGFGKGARTAVGGKSGSGFGVHGESDTGTGVHGKSDSGIGITGTSESAVGVLGASGELPLAQGPGVGVKGMSGTGTGVEAKCDNGIGLHALSQNGLALRVKGRAAFTTAGSGTVPQGQNSVFVANSAVTADTHISVTLVGNPGIRTLHWVQRSPGSGFTVRLTPAPANQRPATAFTYLIVEAAA